MARINYKAIGERIKEIRIKKNLTQEHVAETCDVSPQHISNIENGKTKLSLGLLVQIANCLNVSVDELLSDVVNRSEMIVLKEVKEVFDNCNPEEIRLLLKILKTTKQSLKDLKESYQ